MFGFRFFRIFSMALCLCALNWGQAHAAGADISSKVHAGQSPSVKSTKISGGKSASAKATRSAQKAKTAPKSAAASLHGKASAKSSGKGKRREALPPASPDLPQSGTASWIGREFHGKPVANGERHVMESFTAAHRAVPFDSILKVTDIDSGRSVLVRVNDRGPYVRGRVIDLSRAAAVYLGFAGKGLTRVRMELAGNAKDPAQRYYIRMRPSKDRGKAAPVQGFGPFDTFDEAASLFASLYKAYPDAELTAVREEG